MNKMKLIKTQETLIKVLQEEGNKLYITPETYKAMSSAYIINQNGEEIYEAITYSFMPLIGRENKIELYKGNELKLGLNDLKTYIRRQERQQQRKEATQRRLEAYEAIEYLKGFWEGDNITITGDFIDKVEALSEYLESLKK
jgi:hypothetical protein